MTTRLGPSARAVRRSAWCRTQVRGHCKGVRERRVWRQGSTLCGELGQCNKGHKVKSKGSEIHKARPLKDVSAWTAQCQFFIQTFLTTQTSEGAHQKKRKSTSEPVGCNFSMHNKITLKSNKNKQTNKQTNTRADGGSGTQCSHSRHRLHWETGSHVAHRSRSHRRLQEGTMGTHGSAAVLEPVQSALGDPALGRMTHVRLRAGVLPLHSRTTRAHRTHPCL
jgi:hypothetical protein